MATSCEIEDIPSIQTIEWNMMDKKKYLPGVAVSGFFVRTVLYPNTLIKTRLQVQKQKSLYNGTFDAFRKILRYEGFRGLYRGFWISSWYVLPSMTYITVYETVRHVLQDKTTLQNNTVRSLIAGFSASVAGQTFVVPIDIVTQHLQMMGTTQTLKAAGISNKLSHIKPLPIPPEALKSRLGASVAIVKTLYNQYGISGFYKGYFTSLSLFAPNSAMWWAFYHAYCGFLVGLAPDWAPHLLLQCTAAPMSGTTVTILLNPLDAIRARIQVENTKFMDTTRSLWKEERYRIFTKGLSARLIQSVVFSFCIILPYESIKRWSILDQYKHTVRW